MQSSEAHLRLTEAFVRENPVDIEITRYSTTSDGAGGYVRGAPETLAVQTMRKVASSFKSDLAVRHTSDGREVKPTATMIGLPDVDIQDGDLFIIEGVSHEVVFTERLPKWRVSAEVVELRDAE